VELKDFLSEYRKALKLLEGMGSYEITEKLEVKEGTVYEIPGERGPVWLLAVNVKKFFVEVVPLSFMWELATKHDLIIEFEHPLRDTWIAQIDLTQDVLKETFLVASRAGNVKEEDLTLIRKIISEEVSIPEGRRGSGYKDRVHREFKEIEKERHKFLEEDLFLSMSEDEIILPIPTPLRNLITASYAEVLVAYSQQFIRKTHFGKLVFIPKESKAKLLFNRELLNREGVLLLPLEGKKLPIFSGKIEDMAVVNVTEPLLTALENLEVIV
jgi:hypothetical protein